VGFAPSAAPAAKIALGDPAAADTYRRYLSGRYDAKKFLFAPAAQAQLQIAVLQLLVQADHLHVSLLNRSR
jgi:hypothetical protein